MVAAIRHQLAVPDWRRRGDRKDYPDYLLATEGFSPLFPMTPQVLRNVLPAHPGENPLDRQPRREWHERRSDAVSPKATRVVYIGLTRDLRNRLSDHLRGNSGSVRISSYLA